MRNFVSEQDKSQIMGYLLKHIAFYLIVVPLSIIIFILYLQLTSYSGGEIGMAPFAIAILLVFNFAISFAVVLVLYILKKRISLFQGAIVFNLVSILVQIFYFRSDFTGYLGDVDLWCILSVFLATIICCIFLKINKNFA